VAPKVLAFYEWAGDEIEQERAEALFGPLVRGRDRPRAPPEAK